MLMLTWSLTWSLEPPPLPDSQSAPTYRLNPTAVVPAKSTNTEATNQVGSRDNPGSSEDQ